MHKQQNFSRMADSRLLPAHFAELSQAGVVLGTQLQALTGPLQQLLCLSCSTWSCTIFFSEVKQATVSRLMEITIWRKTFG